MRAEGMHDLGRGWKRSVGRVLHRYRRGRGFDLLFTTTQVLFITAMISYIFIDCSSVFCHFRIRTELYLEEQEELERQKEKVKKELHLTAQHALAIQVPTDPPISYCLFIPFFVQMAIENKIRQRLDLQTTRRQQLEFKEQKRQAEKEEEDEFRRKVKIRVLSCSLKPVCRVWALQSVGTCNLVFNPLTPKSYQCLISPYSNTAQSSIKVVRKKEAINM